MDHGEQSEEPQIKRLRHPVRTEPRPPGITQVRSAVTVTESPSEEGDLRTSFSRI